MAIEQNSLTGKEFIIGSSSVLRRIEAQLIVSDPTRVENEFHWEWVQNGQAILSSGGERKEFEIEALRLP